MSVSVLLLRGINVGGRNALPMAELRALGVPATARNWRTVEAIARLADERRA